MITDDRRDWLINEIEGIKIQSVIDLFKGDGSQTVVEFRKPYLERIQELEKELG